MAPHFCCCLPIRLGALLITGISSLCTLLVSVALWFLFAKKHDVINTKRQEIALIVVASGYSIAGIVSTIAFFGVIGQKLKLIKTYVSFYSLFLGATWGYSIIYIIMLFKSHQESVTSCQQVSQDLKSCEKSVTVSRTSVVVSTVLSLLLQTYALVIVYQYGHRLEDKTAGTRSFQLNGGPSYAQAPLNESHADYAPKAYAYNDPHNSFGNDHHV